MTAVWITPVRRVIGLAANLAANLMSSAIGRAAMFLNALSVLDQMVSDQNQPEAAKRGSPVCPAPPGQPTSCNALPSADCSLELPLTNQSSRGGDTPAPCRGDVLRASIWFPRRLGLPS